MKHLFQLLLVISMLYSPAAFAQANEKTQEQETKQEELKTAFIQEVGIQNSSAQLIPPRIIKFHITPNPTRHGERVSIEYEVIGTQPIEITYTLDGRYITKEKLLQRLNDFSITSEWSADVAINAANEAGMDHAKVKILKFAKPSSEL